MSAYAGSVAKGARQLLYPAVAMVWMLCASVAAGQTTSRLSGRVLDRSGGVVVGAVIVLESAQGALTGTTDRDGRFVFDPVPTGAVHVTATSNPAWGRKEAEYVSRSLSLQASYAWTDAFVSRDASTPTGTPLPNVPRHGGSFLANYRLTSGPLAGLSLGGSVYALDRRRVALFSSFQLDGYVRTDLFATYRVAHWRVQLNVKNAGNGRYFDSTSFNIHPQAPRQIVVGLARQF